MLSFKKKALPKRGNIHLRIIFGVQLQNDKLVIVFYES